MTRMRSSNLSRRLRKMREKICSYLSIPGRGSGECKGPEMRVG